MQEEKYEYHSSLFKYGASNLLLIVIRNSIDFAKEQWIAWNHVKEMETACGSLHFDVPPCLESHHLLLGLDVAK